MEIKHGEEIILSAAEMNKLKQAGIATLMEENGLNPNDYHFSPAGKDLTRITNKKVN